MSTTRVQLLAALSLASLVLVFIHMYYAQDVYIGKNLRGNSTKILQTLDRPIGKVQQQQTRKNITILWYFLPRYLAPMPNMQNLKACPNEGCILTRNRSLINESDAIIFSAEHIRENPPKRPPGQVWVYHNNEPPFLFLGREFSRPPWSSAFNWTMDFRHDADIVRPYAVLRTRNVSITKNYTDILKKKTKAVAIMVSNCNNWSGRLEYVKELKKSIPVDVFGDCGNIHKFNRNNNDEWLEYLSSNYYFYLAFENLYCKDYISEKFFNNFNLDLVTVARGGGNYSRDVPQGTFINVADFESPKMLASRLQFLIDNPEQYINLLKSKETYFYETETYKHGNSYLEHYYEQEPLCELCRRLKSVEKYGKIITDINKWFRPGVCRKRTHY